MKEKLKKDIFKMYIYDYVEFCRPRNKNPDHKCQKILFHNVKSEKVMPRKNIRIYIMNAITWHNYKAHVKKVKKTSILHWVYETKEILLYQMFVWIEGIYQKERKWEESWTGTRGHLHHKTILIGSTRYLIFLVTLILSFSLFCSTFCSYGLVNLITHYS